MSTVEKKVKESSGGQGFISLPDEGKRLSALGTDFKLKAVSGDTSGLFEALEGVWPPQEGFAPHTHGFDEGVYVLEGTMTLELGDRTVKASAGSFAFIPRGMVHSWQNESMTTACKLLLLFVPSFGPGCQGLMEELNQLSPCEPDMARVAEIFKRYDTVFVGYAD